jgi:hypothetical protein
MANNFSGITTYVNELRRTDFWLEALSGNDVMPFVEAVGDVIPNVKENSFTLKRLSGSVTFADGAACSDDFDNGNDTTITQTTINLVKLLAQDSFCMHGEGYETYFTAPQMPLGQHYAGLAPWQQALVNEIMRRLAKRYGVNFWQGNQSGDTHTLNGWIDLLLSASMGIFNSSSNVTGGNIGTTTPTSGGSAGTDAEGVYNICQSLVEAAMYTTSLAGSDLQADLMAGNCYIVMNPLNREFLRQNYQKKHGLAMPEIVPGLAGLQQNAMGAFNFPGYNLPVITQVHIPQSTIILSRKGNQVIAFDAVSDTTKLDVWLADDHDTVRWKHRSKLGLGWRALDGSNLKYWGPTT